MRRNILVIASILLISISTIAWSNSPRPPHKLAPGEMLFEFNDPDVQHDMGCGGTDSCLVAELVEIESANGVSIGTAREEVYEITPKVGLPGAHVRAKLFFTFVNESGAELGRLETDEFVVDAAMAEAVPTTGQLKFNTWWDGTVHGTSGIYAGKSGKMHMRGHNVTHPDPATGIILVDEFYNTYVVSDLR